MFIWKMVQQLIKNNVRINWFCILTNLLWPQPVWHLKKHSKFIDIENRLAVSRGGVGVGDTVIHNVLFLVQIN